MNNDYFNSMVKANQHRQGTHESPVLGCPLCVQPSVSAEETERIQRINDDANAEPFPEGWKKPEEVPQPLDFSATRKFLDNLHNPKPVPIYYQVVIIWHQQLGDRNITRDSYFKSFQNGSIQLTDNLEYACVVTEELAPKVLHRIQTVYPKSRIEPSLLDNAKTTLAQCGYPEALEAVRAASRAAAADGFSYEEIKESLTDGFMFTSLPR